MGYELNQKRLALLQRLEAELAACSKAMRRTNLTTASCAAVLTAAIVFAAADAPEPVMKVPSPHIVIAPILMTHPVPQASTFVIECYRAQSPFSIGSDKFCDEIEDRKKCDWQLADFVRVEANSQSEPSTADKHVQAALGLYVLAGHDSTPVVRGGDFDSNIELASLRANAIVAQLRPKLKSPLVPLPLAHLPEQCRPNDQSSESDDSVRRTPALLLLRADHAQPKPESDEVLNAKR